MTNKLHHLHVIIDEEDDAYEIISKIKMKISDFSDSSINSTLFYLGRSLKDMEKLAKEIYEDDLAKDLKMAEQLVEMAKTILSKYH